MCAAEALSNNELSLARLLPEPAETDLPLLEYRTVNPLITHGFRLGIKQLLEAKKAKGRVISQAPAARSRG